MSGLLSEYARVTERVPCAICGHGGWCLRARDGSDRAICARVESPRRWGKAGWFHGSRTTGRTQRKYHLDETPDESRFRLIADEGRQRAGELPAVFARFAAKLGVTVAALEALSVGLDDRPATTWPMRDHLGRFVGIRERYRGQKRAAKGSRNGLFLPQVPEDALVLVTEGESDCAAALSLGFFAIGRPGCQGATDYLARWFRSRAERDAVLVADADEPGRAGASALAALLAPTCRTVRIIQPPREAKDLRSALCAGTSRDEVLAAIEGAAIVPPTLRLVERQVR
ncbi:MAG: hypothetical protein JNK02_01695 [Planctomycetes bacterium]|nr:hypothetical protein [Planctomycetota bacterium]